MGRNERAVSVPVNYTLSIVIVTVLLSGLVLSMGDQLRAQQERTVDSEFDVLGNRMAADINAADRLAGATEGTTADTVVVRTEIPDTVGGMTYRIEVDSTSLGGGAYQVTVTFVSSEMGITEVTQLKTATPVESGSISGGEYVIEYVDTTGDSVPDSLEVKNV